MIPLESPRWYLSEDQKTLVIVLTEAAPSNHEDPANFVPEFTRTVEVPLPRNAKRDPV